MDVSNKVEYENICEACTLIHYFPKRCGTCWNLIANKESVAEVPCGDGLSAKDINLIKGHYDRCMRNAEATKDDPDCASNAHDQWLEEADSYQKILLILESR